MYTTDGKLLATGKTVVFETGGRSICGVYQGMTKKGALMFDSIISGAQVRFNVMPNSIGKIFLASVEVEADLEDSE